MRRLNDATEEEWDAAYESHLSAQARLHRADKALGIRSDEFVVPVKATDKQEGGEHYKLPIQPIEYITKNKLGYMEGNVIKYVTRHKSKNGAEDIRKAIHYLEMILESEYAN